MAKIMLCDFHCRRSSTPSSLQVIQGKINNNSSDTGDILQQQVTPDKVLEIGICPKNDVQPNFIGVAILIFKRAHLQPNSMWVIQALKAVKDKAVNKERQPCRPSSRWLQAARDGAQPGPSTLPQIARPALR